MGPTVFAGTSPNPSPRECAQNHIIDFLERHASHFNAPYGVLPGMQKAPGRFR